MPSPKRINTFHDVWDSLNTLDSEIINGKDLDKTKARIQVSRQRIEMIKVAVKAGIMNGKYLALSASK